MCARLSKILDKATSCSKWPIWTAVHLQNVVSDSGRFVVMGDAAHDMTPHLGQGMSTRRVKWETSRLTYHAGAAMALEDAALIGALLENVCTPSQLPFALERYQTVRVPRTEVVRMEAIRNNELWHLPDGRKQQRRDRNALGTSHDGCVEGSPYIFSHPVGQSWLYNYDVEEAMKGAQDNTYHSSWS